MPECGIILSLWTGIMLQAETIGYENKTRLSNNPVENWFSIIKDNMLLKKKSSTSEIVSIFYKRLMAKYFSNYCHEHDLSKIHLKETLIEEKWRTKPNKAVLNLLKVIHLLIKIFSNIKQFMIIKLY